MEQIPMGLGRPPMPARGNPMGIPWGSHGSPVSAWICISVPRITYFGRINCWLVNPNNCYLRMFSYVPVGLSPHQPFWLNLIESWGNWNVIPFRKARYIDLVVRAMLRVLCQSLILKIMFVVALRAGNIYIQLTKSRPNFHENIFSIVVICYFVYFRIKKGVIMILSYFLLYLSISIVF